MTHPKPGLPRVSTVLLAAARPESGLSTHPFCPSKWSQISSFSVVTSLYVTQWQFPVCLRLLWMVRLCSCLLSESEVRQNCHVKSNRSFWQCVYVCECEERILGVSLREEHLGPNLLLKPSSDGPMQRRSDLGKLCCIGCNWLLPIPTGSYTNVLYMSSF